MTNDIDKIKSKIAKLEKEREDTLQSTLVEIRVLGAKGLYYARANDKNMTLYIVDCLNIAKSKAEYHNVVKSVNEINVQLDKIEEITNKW